MLIFRFSERVETVNSASVSRQFAFIDIPNAFEPDESWEQFAIAQIYIPMSVWSSAVRES